jgi:energy-converting hydrogenase B subunit D
MTVLQALALLLVAGSGTAVVLVRDPLRQAPLTGIFGLALALLFTLLQAPDVALSQIVVGGVALPAMALLALAKIREHGG